jgi:hypothetical protein
VVLMQQVTSLYMYYRFNSNCGVHFATSYSCYCLNLHILDSVTVMNEAHVNVRFFAQNHFD